MVPPEMAEISVISMISDVVTRFFATVGSKYYSYKNDSKDRKKLQTFHNNNGINVNRKVKTERTASAVTNLFI